MNSIEMKVVHEAKIKSSSSQDGGKQREKHILIGLSGCESN